MLRPLPPTALESASFIGYTNYVVGTFGPVFGIISTTHAATIQRWLDAGTNAALFTITNRQVCAILLSPLANTYKGGPRALRESKPLIDAGFPGIRLAPGQVVTVPVAIIPSHAAQNVEFYYTRDIDTDSFFNRVRHLPEDISRSVLKNRPVRVETFKIMGTCN